MFNLFKFLIRLLKHIGILVLVSIPMQLLSFIVVPIVLLCIKNRLRFPAAVKWFDSADAWVGRDTSTYEAVIQQGFLARWHWLSIRNPCNYLGYVVLGVKEPADATFAVCQGPILVGDNEGKVPGLLITECFDKDKKIWAYEYYYIHKWSATKCFRFRLGYKVGIFEDNKIGDSIQQVLVLQPFKSYSGK